MLSIACRELDRQFQRCSEDLDVIATKLETEFETNDKLSRNPAKLLQRVKALEQDLPKIQDDWKRIMVAKQTIIDVARAQQLANNRMLKQIACAGDVKVEDDSETFGIFLKYEAQWDKENDCQIIQLREALHDSKLLNPEELNMEVMRSAVIDLRCKVSFGDSVKDAHDESTCINSPDGEPADSASSQLHPAPESAAAPASGTASAAAAVTASAVPPHRISEAEFLSVSNIVRGRCRLDECNELLDILVAHCRRVGAAAAGTSAGAGAGGGGGGGGRTLAAPAAGRGGSQAAAGPLSTSELVKLGARVTGQTGGSRLATLRCLKRICITKDGVTLNPKWLPR